MERASPPLEEALVGHLVGEGVLEGIGQVGDEVHLVEELGRFEVSQTPAQLILAQLHDGLKESQRHLSADDGRRLQQVLLLWRRRSMREARLGSSPRSACSGSSAFSGGNGSSRSWV